MSDDRFYPPINPQSVKSLLVARRLASEDASYLTDHACPYDDAVKQILSWGANTSAGVARDEEEKDHTKPVDQLAEVEGLYRDLQDYGKKVKDSGDPSDKNTFFRVSTSLLEKLIVLKERAVGVKNVDLFTTAVLDILEDELDADSRASILERLKGILSQ